MFEWILTSMVLVGVSPLLASLFQFVLIGFHGRKPIPHKNNFPRLAIIIPAWNEEGVIGNTVESLMKLHYPKSKLKIYIIDDASTDDTPEIAKRKHNLYPENVYHMRRENGGQGKAHTLNYGIKKLLKQGWFEALMIIDADVLFEKYSLIRMTRHLNDKSVGSVTAYIKEGSFPGNLITRFIAFEYITAQAASRRAQNLLQHLACLAGGAQLHTAENLKAIGGAIDTSSLAEDTFTTFKTQISGRKAVFEPNAIVWAEEPDTLDAVWKQRLRWARGNIQVTKAFKHLWFNRSISAALGSVSFAFLWFPIMLMPFFLIFGSVGLISLYFLDFPLSWKLFQLVWIINIIIYLFITLFSFEIDPSTAKRAWFEGFLFPGIISMVIMCFSINPIWLEGLLFVDKVARPSGFSWQACVILFMYAWLSLGMLAAYLTMITEKKGVPELLVKFQLLLAGFGPFLCMITLNSYISELQKKELKWDKTEKKGNVKILGE
ncbi:glycosyltransferase family 2 protein [Kangiella sp. HZ709]|uniref:glycosyltransferase family 2 protein n=1 Tax=Kangiella sp. HZ709 TaxID=2666328 RepID=UPI0012B1204F|nr:glycosyltransferase [Kangiella sp. HZ709]MRX27256.1 glycosyltransferase [Kangiella sp. HZ709]